MLLLFILIPFCCIIFQMIEFLGDGQYNVPAILSGLSHIQRDRETYFYVFSHSSQQSGHNNYQVLPKS